MKEKAMRDEKRKEAEGGREKDEKRKEWGGASERSRRNVERERGRKERIVCAESAIDDARLKRVK